MQMDLIYRFAVLNNKNKDVHPRKIRESFWIKKLQTLKPKGPNMNSGIGDIFRM